MDDAKDDSGDEMLDFLYGVQRPKEEAGASALDMGIIVGGEEDIHNICSLPRFKKREERERNQEIEQLKRNIKTY